MRSRWSEEEALGFVARYGAQWGEPLALRTYSSRLLGADPELVLHQRPAPDLGPRIHQSVDDGDASIAHAAKRRGLARDWQVRATAKENGKRLQFAAFFVNFWVDCVLHR